MNLESRLTARIALAADAAGGQSQLADLLGVARQQVHTWVTGKALPNSASLLRIAAAAKIDPSWLITGVGAPFPGIANMVASADGATQLHYPGSPFESMTPMPVPDPLANPLVVANLALQISIGALNKIDRGPLRMLAVQLLRQIEMDSVTSAPASPYSASQEYGRQPKRPLVRRPKN